MRTLVLLILLVSSAAAQEFSPHPLPQGSWTFEFWGGGAESPYGSASGTHIWSAGFRVGKVLTAEHGRGFYRGNLEYAFDVVPVLVVRQNGQSVHGGGFDPIILRWNFTPRRRLAPYFEFTGGGIFTTENVPSVPGGTSNFNFITQGGPGLRILLRQHHAVTIAAKYFHISNATLGTRNPGINGIQLIIGHQWSR